MKFVSSESSFSILTSLPLESVRTKLEQAVGERRRMFFGTDKEFEGEVYQSGFEIREAVGYMYGLLPVFRGTYRETQDGLVIRIRVSNLARVLTGILAWGWTAATFYLGFSELVRQRHDLREAVAWLLFGSVIAALNIGEVVLYRRAVRHGKNRLSTLLTADEGKPRGHPTIPPIKQTTAR